MRCRSIKLAAWVLAGTAALATTGLASAKKPPLAPPFKGTFLDAQGMGPGQHVYPGAKLYYDLSWYNIRSKRINGKLGIDIRLPKQVVDSVKLDLPPGGVKLSQHISGKLRNHIVYVVGGIPAQNGVGVVVFAHVSATARGRICNKYHYSLGGVWADYSNLWAPKLPCSAAIRVPG